jgi:hypothetical protein
MEDLNGSGSNPEISEDAGAAVETPQPASSTRDALAKAFESTFGKEDAPEAKADAKAERARDESGKFAPKPVDAPAKPVDAKPIEVAPVEAPKPETPAVAAPARFTAEAKAAFEAAPAPLKAEIARLETELTKGIAEYKDRFEPIKRFDDMARSGGTTLDKALESYVGIENLLRTDPVKGFQAICQNAGIDPRAIGQALAGMQSQGGSLPEVAALKAQIADLQSQIGGVSQNFAQREIMTDVQKFAADNPRLDELSGPIKEMLESGFAKGATPLARLQDAYDKAVKLNPAPVVADPAIEPAPVAAPQTPAPAQTRKASLSLTGSPSGSNPGTRTPAGSTREALARSFSQVGLK